MDWELIELLAKNAAVCFGSAGIVYAGISYISISSDPIQTRTRKISTRVAQDLGNLDTRIVSKFSLFEDDEADKRLRGENINVAKIIENNLKINAGQVPDLDIFIEDDTDSVKANCGLLFANSMYARNSFAYPLELVAASMASALAQSPRITDGVFAYDKDLKIIKSFDQSHDQTVDGILPLFKGHHEYADIGLKLAAEQFPGSGQKNILYVVCPKIPEKRKEKVQSAIRELRSQHIQPAFLYLAKRKSDITNPPGEVYDVITRDRLQQLPSAVERINDKLRDTGL